MSRRLTVVILGLVISLAPTVSFAFNAAALASAKSCCEGMANSCSEWKTPLECCDKDLVTIESIVELAKIAAHIDLPPTRYGAQPTNIEIFQSAYEFAVSPIASSPPVVLRI
jgi:hypothetical protein